MPRLTSVRLLRCRGSWFYIDDADLDSKLIFSLLSQLFALQAGKEKGTPPMLTLPIGGCWLFIRKGCVCNPAVHAGDTPFSFR